MVHIDMTQPDREMRPGVDLWEIVKCNPDRSSKGDPMLKIELARVSDPSDRVSDNIMLAGKGWGIGKAKLGALLDPGFNGDLDPLDFVERRLWVETGVEDYVSKAGKPGQALRVLIAGLKHAGYQRENDPPPGHSAPPPVADAPAGFMDDSPPPF
jgi:hypothetical protein